MIENKMNEPSIKIKDLYLPLLEVLRLEDDYIKLSELERKVILHLCVTEDQLKAKTGIKGHTLLHHNLYHSRMKLRELGLIERIGPRKPVKITHEGIGALINYKLNNVKLV